MTPAMDKYVVTFNCNYKRINVGTPELRTIDYTGDNIDGLASVVIRQEHGDLEFRKESDDKDLLGIFVSGKDLKALMLKTPYMLR